MEKTFQTGSFSFRLRFPEELVLPADMEKFAVEKESTDYTYTITIVDILPEAEGELLVNRVDLQVFRNGEGLESRLIGVKGEERPYALYRETAQKHAQVFVGRWYLDGVAKYEVVFLSLLALERRLSERLHTLVRVIGVTGEQIEMDVYGIDPAQIRKDEKAVIQAISLVEGISAEDLCQISVSEKIIDVNIDNVPDKPYHGCARERWIRA